MEYDVNFHQLKNVSLSAGANYDRASFQASWFRGQRLAVVADRRTVSRDSIRTSARLNVFPGKLALDGSAYYNLLTKELLQWSGRARYDVQCCGFVAQVIKSAYNAAQDTRFLFSIQLANIGSIGNFGEGDGPGFRSAR
jgi:hypothetical protein